MTTTHLALPRRVAIVIWGLPLVLVALSTLYLLTATRSVSGSHSDLLPWRDRPGLPRGYPPTGFLGPEPNHPMVTGERTS
jgi:hypothetical protein